MALFGNSSGGTITIINQNIKFNCNWISIFYSVKHFFNFCRQFSSSKMALFGNSSGGTATSKNLVEFKCGKLNLGEVFKNIFTSDMT